MHGAVRIAAAGVLAAFVVSQPAKAGHESPFYPSFYPQEIRIETLDPASVIQGWAKTPVHAYVGDDLFAGGNVPADAAAVASLRSYLVLSFDAEHGRYAVSGSDAPSRCAAARRVLPRLARDGYIFHPYPVTPYHSDYLEHSDLASEALNFYQTAPVASVSQAGLKIRPKGPLAQALVPAASAADSSDWDATLEEVGVRTVMPSADAVHAVPPWVKQGWFQAYLLYQGHRGGAAEEPGLEKIHSVLVTGAYRDTIERVNLSRKLVKLLVDRCERIVVGYTVQHEYFNADYSNGVENVGFDSQTGLLSAIFPRTVKLKDFPWNGWLRLGIAAKPTAAWNPVGGFDDAFGRLLWLTVADPALLPEPYGGSWIANRASVTVGKNSGTVNIPSDALLPEKGSGILKRVGAGKRAQQKLRYSLITSAFHDGTMSSVADVLYPYIFALRQAAHSEASADRSKAIASPLAPLLTDWLAAFKLIGVETQTRDYGSDLKFSYRVPVVDVYLNHRSSDMWEAAAIAPPWSTLPWELIVLMEEADDRGIAAFSLEEAQRRGIPWLDLVRDPSVGAQLNVLVEKFRQESYRPEALKELVTAQEASARWSALGEFYQRYRHFLVTNGPYRLDSWTPDRVVLQVFRDLSYPLGVGSLDQYAIPRRAYVSGIEDRGDHLEISADVDQVSRAQRSYEIQRVALAEAHADAESDELPICRYVIVGPTGSVVRAGTAMLRRNRVFVVDLAPLRASGLYTIAAALFIGGNAMNPEVKLIKHRVAERPPSNPATRER
ncbi:MAG TPA: hypothetical protein VKG21_19730 [Casimicrobiaceae bacterium]|nr:hypothetical protein [Casimicrobiaceae bacterium]